LVEQYEAVQVNALALPPQAGTIVRCSVHDASLALKAVASTGSVPAVLPPTPFHRRSK
jgi:hypothetical protein